MEEASAWCYRARKTHKLLDRGMARAFNRKDIIDAENRLAGGGNEDDLVVARQLVKVGSVIDFMIKDTDARTLRKAILFVEPLQSFLNDVFAAEKSRHQSSWMLSPDTKWCDGVA